MKQLSLTLFETLFKFIQDNYRLSVCNSSVKRNQQGQGLIEYMLMLVIIVAMVIGLNRSLGNPLKDYTKNFVSDMVRCIIETGLLPQQAMEVCGLSISVNLSEFSIQTNSSGVSNRSGVGGGSNSNNKASGSDSEESGDDDGDSNAASNNRKASNNQLRAQPRSNFNAIDSGGNSSESKERSLSKDSFGNQSGEGDELSGSAAGGSGVTVIRRRRRQGVSGTFSIGDDSSIKKEELKPADINVSRKLDVKEEVQGDNPKGPQTFEVGSDKDRGPASIEDEEMGGFSFGKFLKWGIIIAILIIFGVFMMNQLNSIRKGWTS